MQIRVKVTDGLALISSVGKRGLDDRLLRTTIPSRICDHHSISNNGSSVSVAGLLCHRLGSQFASAALVSESRISWVSF
jgi:hypothetical protein